MGSSRGAGRAACDAAARRSSSAAPQPRGLSPHPVCPHRRQKLQRLGVDVPHVDRGGQHDRHTEALTQRGAARQRCKRLGGALRVAHERQLAGLACGRRDGEGETLRWAAPSGGLCGRPRPRDDSNRRVFTSRPQQATHRTPLPERSRPWRAGRRKPSHPCKVKTVAGRQRRARIGLRAPQDAPHTASRAPHRYCRPPSSPPPSLALPRTQPAKVPEGGRAGIQPRVVSTEGVAPAVACTRGVGASEQESRSTHVAGHTLGALQHLAL